MAVPVSKKEGTTNPDPMRILLVDDCGESRQLLAALLFSAGYTEVIEAASAAEVFSMLADSGATRQRDIDLVLLDINLGAIDGIEVCRRLRADPWLADTPVIMVTADDRPHLLSQAFEAGAVDYMTKPVRKIELLARVRSALSLKREIDARKSREEDLVAKNAQLQQAMREIQVLRGLMRICSFCKKIQNDEGNWQQIELYIRDHSEAEFTHGICQDCAKNHFPGLLQHGGVA